MKACRYYETGSPDVLRYEDVPDPQPRSGEVVVDVQAAALNRLDLFLRAGASTMPGFSLPHTGGFDIAGIVSQIGDGVDPSVLGKEVIVKARVTGPAARGRLDIIGINRPGGFAEKVLVPAHRLADRPPNYTFEESAAFGCVYLTAWYGLMEKARLRPGEAVLVHAAGSGAGTAAIQTARAAGANVIATAGSDEKCALARERLGVDCAINYRTQNVADAVLKFTGGRGADVAFDPVWGDSARQTLDCMALGGRWIVIGMVGGLTANLHVSKLLFNEISIAGIVEFYADDAVMDAALRLAHQGKVRPLIARRFPLSQLAEAHQCMENGDFFGKIVVMP